VSGDVPWSPEDGAGGVADPEPSCCPPSVCGPAVAVADVTGTPAPSWLAAIGGDMGGTKIACAGDADDG